MIRYPVVTLALLSIACSVLADTAITVDEILVTARKKEEQRIEVPLSVSAFSEQTIRDLGLNRLGDVARFTPGFAFEPNVGRQPAADRPVIRGLTTVINGIANASSAATFIDGVYFGGSIQSTALYNVERVEILRGPQSVQYGRGTYAGAINYVTRDPGETLSGEVIASAAEHDTVDVGGWLSGPLLGSSLGFYLAAGHREYGGEYVNTIDGEKVGGEKTDEITAKLRWKPADSFAATWQIAWQSTDDEHYPSYLQPRTLNNCCFRTPDAPRAREYYAGTAVPEERVTLATDLLAVAGGAGTQLDRWFTSLDMEWTSDSGYVLQSLTGYVDDELERGFDSSYAGYEPFPPPPPSPFSPGPGMFTKVEDQAQTDFSQELRLSSPVDRAVTWVIGGYYYSGEVEDISSNGVYRDVAGAIVVERVDPFLTRDEIENLAAFGGVDWAFAEHWSAGLELRWARDEITVTNRANDGVGAVAPPSPFSETFNSLTPRFTLSYLPAVDRNWYLSVAKGTKPGDFNSRVPDEAYRAVDEETVWSYEAGFKARWADRVTTALAAYFMDVDDQQLTTLVELPDGGSTPILQNVGRSAIWGIEADLTAALTEHFSVNLTYSYTNAEYRDHISIDEADLRGSDGSVEQTNALGDVSGNKLPRVPEHMASVLSRYERSAFGDWNWYVNGDYSFESSKYAQEHNLIETGNRHLLGLRAGMHDESWDLSIWVTNLLDDDTPVDVQRYFDSRSGTLPSYPQAGGRVSSQPRGFVLSLPRGRQYGATLRFRF